MVRPVLHELVEPHPWLEMSTPWFPLQRLMERERWKQGWDRAARRAIETSNAEELHSVRGDYEAVLRGHLKMLDGYLMVMDRFNGDLPHHVPLGRAIATRDQLQQHYDSLFPRWQTLDDLEGILLESISPTHDQLKPLAASHSPPQSWYDEPSDPPSE